MVSRLGWRGLLLALAGLLASCGPYWSARRRDLDESFLASVELGFGVAADVKAGPLAVGVGLSPAAWGWGKPTWWRWASRYAVENVVVPQPQVGALLAAADLDSSGLLRWAGMTQLLTVTVDDVLVYDRLAYLGVTNLFTLEDAHPGRPSTMTRKQRLVDDFGLQAGVFAGVVGLRFGFNPAEFADFLVGWFGVELVGGLEPPAPDGGGSRRRP